ncbi:SRPBCC family protein [Nocardia gipuzkoensis]|uniref:SRPBCC family protein n=1 Tax=Nocardia gipuzkoensis TaxID=2749991 RepID=UPI00237E67ED|nr:SRPBCC family protein [Nocardia gipuzkoensis]MDE1671926.1 SRPBCC family protein [Nocardia gipuzkoensis]
MTDIRSSSTTKAQAESGAARRSGRAALRGIALTAAILGATVTPALADGPAVDSAPLTCAGEGIDAAAPIHYRTETLIKAPLDTIWNLQTDVARWPSWQKPVTSVERLDSGPLQAGSRFRWTTPVPATATTPATTLTITSTVQQLRHNQCIRWSGPAIGDGLGIDGGIHVWTFTPVDGGVLVRTEENWHGAQVEADVPTSTHFLGAGLEAWLADLRTAAEG